MPRGHFKTSIWTTSDLFACWTLSQNLAISTDMPAIWFLVSKTKIFAFVSKAGFETPSWRKE